MIFKRLIGSVVKSRLAVAGLYKIRRRICMDRKRSNVVMRNPHGAKVNGLAPSVFNHPAATKSALVTNGLDVMGSCWALVSYRIARFLGKIVAGSAAIAVFDVALSAIGLLLMFGVLLFGAITNGLSRDAPMEHSILKSSRSSR